MRIGDFSVEIQEGREVSDGYVEMRHGQQYSIKLTNHMPGNRRCAAEIRVDGKVVGTFRLTPSRGGSLVLERPTNDVGKFTFYRVDSTEANQVGLNNVPVEDRGLITVLFKPERYVPAVEVIQGDKTHWFPEPLSPWVSPARIGADYALGAYPDDYKVKGMSSSYSSCGEVKTRSVQHVNSTKNYSAGGTGLSGSSNQRFRTVENLDYDDPSTFVRINLRLVAAQDSPRTLVSAGYPMSNPVPRPL